MLNHERYQVVSGFIMPQLGRERTIRIYLPIGYHQSKRSYPVIYMHDGQNLFDPAISYGGETWQIPQTLDRLFTEDNGVIVVGIDNGAEYGALCRWNEYSPWKMDQNFFLPGSDPSVRQSGGQGGEYIKFITDTLKPYIDLHYRTLPDRENTTIAGSSMGGLISLYGLMERPDIFSKAGVFSPAFWFNQSEMASYIERCQLSIDVMIYMDMGTQESSGDGINFEKIYLDGANSINLLLQRKQNVSLHYVIDEGGKHKESAWARRFPDMLDFLL